jgi:hypothetical protein
VFKEVVNVALSLENGFGDLLLAVLRVVSEGRTDVSSDHSLELRLLLDFVPVIRN